MHVHARVVVVAITLACLAGVSGCKEKKALVVLRNSLPTDVTVTLDHKEHVVGPRQAVPVELPPGDYEMTASGLMLLDNKTVSLKSADGKSGQAKFKK